MDGSPQEQGDLTMQSPGPWSQILQASQSPGTYISSQAAYLWITFFNNVEKFNYKEDIVCIGILFLLIAECYSTVWMYYNLFSHSPIDGHWVVASFRPLRMLLTRRGGACL